ncbi:hypothetical protein FB45DRAFT_1039927 [Roridomyces roridus]|uniref:Uncharacterized protein n=1 Tax=Roridomyces roridus TaxID=1738132 RepID=A0AAD7F811_9AGAR|nr:hypothetical protein FB45DRAFT_1039927 [Roridomyces roridus]
MDVWDPQVLHLVLTEDLLPLLPALSNRIPLLRKLCIQWNGSESEGNASEESEEDPEESVDCFETAGSWWMSPWALGYHLSIFLHISLPATTLLRPGISIGKFWPRPPASLWPVYLLTTRRSGRSPDHETEWTEPDDSEIIDLPKLQYLYASHLDVLAHLKMPSLEQVTLELNVFTANVGKNPALDQFLTDSSDTVRRLCLIGFLDAESAEAILKNYPLLEEFAIIFDNEDGVYDTACTVITALDVRDGNRGFPRMTRIDFAFHGELALEEKTYVEMLASRFHMHRSALESAMLCIGTATQDSIYDYLKDWETELDELQDAGLDFTLFNGTDDVLEPMDRWLCTQTWG